MVQYYDLILGLIPLALGGITIALLAVGVSLTVAVPLAAVVAVALIGHGMFVNSPGAPTSQPDPTPQRENAPFNSAD